MAWTAFHNVQLAPPGLPHVRSSRGFSVERSQSEGAPIGSLHAPPELLRLRQPHHKELVIAASKFSCAPWAALLQSLQTARHTLRSTRQCVMLAPERSPALRLMEDPCCLLRSRSPGECYHRAGAVTWTAPGRHRWAPTGPAQGAVCPEGPPSSSLAHGRGAQRREPQKSAWPLCWSFQS